MKNKVLFLVLVIFVLAIPLTPAHAGILEFFFPMLKKEEPDPGKTLQAPFAYEKPVEGPSNTEAKKDPHTMIAMHLPHLGDNVVSEWLMTAVSESMTFSSEDYSQDVANSKIYFSPTGQAEFTKFLEEKSILKVLESKKFFIRSFVQDLPLILNEGAVDGQYKWLFEVPVMLTYMDRSMKDYKKAVPVNQKIILTVQLSRTVGDSKDHVGVVIDRWSGKAQILDKK